MPIMREKTDLDKRWTWFLFLGANVLVVLGCAITWAVFANSTDNNTYWIPTLVCNLLAIILAAIFMYFELKDISPKIMHFQKKWLKWYIVAASVFVAAILFNVMYFLFFLNAKGGVSRTTLLNEKWQFIIYLTITAVLTLVAIGLQRYARFRIDLDVYRRKRGEANKDNVTQDVKQESKPVEKPNKEKTKNGPTKASGGLLDKMD